jgi:hypothetical protein
VCLSIFRGPLNLGGLSGDERRSELVRRIRERSTISGYKGTDHILWAVEISSYSQAQAQASEVRYSCSAYNMG